MKFIKKTLAYILPAMMLLGSTTACSDFINIDPENKVPEQSVDFTNTGNMYQPVVGVYSKVRTSAMHWANALIMLRQGQAIMTHLTQVSPDNAQWKQDLIWFDKWIAELK